MRWFFIFILANLLALTSSAQWELKNSRKCSSLDFVNDSTGVITNNDDNGIYIMITTDYGVSWDTVLTFSILSAIVHDVVFASDSTLFLCGQTNLFMKSTDFGQTWFDPIPGTNPSFQKMFFIDEALGYACSGDGDPRLGVTTDGGISWTINEALGAISLTGNQNCEISGTIGNRLHRSSDCGINWATDTLPIINRIWNANWPINSSVYCLGGMGGYGTDYQFNYGTLARYTEGVESIYVLDIPYTIGVNDLFFVDDNNGYAACTPYPEYPYSILKTTDGGTTWGYQELPYYEEDDMYPSIGMIDCPSPGNCFAGGQGIYRTTNGGGMLQEGWIEVSNLERSEPTSVLMVYPSPADHQVTLEFPGYINSDELLVLDVAGTLVKSMSIEQTKKTTFNVEALSPGIYLVVLKSNAGVVGRLVVE